MNTVNQKINHLMSLLLQLNEDNYCYYLKIDREPSTAMIDISIYEDIKNSKLVSIYRTTYIASYEIDLMNEKHDSSFKDLCQKIQHLIDFG